MGECVFCELVDKDHLSNLILENDHALAIADNYFREGHCNVILRRHIKSVSELEQEEYNSIFVLINKVSTALEKKYDCEKTYLLSIGDKVNHLHFHLIPKHKDKCSMGMYCFERLFEIEGERKPAASERDMLANEIKKLL
jgi:diadenosine tetraphosphate (Ap4A) HIT family hydrolase